MIPKRKAYPRKYYWTCSNEKHHHTYRHIAKECIARQVIAAARTKKYGNRFAIAFHRRQYVIMQLCKGQTMVALAKELKLSIGTIKSDMNKALRLIQRNKEVMALLPDSAFWYSSRGAYRHLDLHSVAQLRADADFWHYIFDVYYPSMDGHSWKTISMLKITEELANDKTT